MGGEFQESLLGCCGDPKSCKFVQSILTYPLRGIYLLTRINKTYWVSQITCQSCEGQQAQ